MHRLFAELNLIAYYKIPSNIINNIECMSKNSALEFDDELEEGEAEQSESEGEYISVKKANKKIICMVCEKSMSKYTCPQCKVRSCSIRCSNAHKRKPMMGSSQKCKGIVAANGYVPEMTEKAVEKDYEYITDMISNCDKVKKNLVGLSKMEQVELKRFKILSNNAYNLHQIHLEFAPALLSRHRENISFFFMKDKSIFWVIELLYLIKPIRILQKPGQNKSLIEKVKDFNQFESIRHLTEPICDERLIKQVLPKEKLILQLLNEGISTEKMDQLILIYKHKKRDQTFQFIQCQNDSKIKEILKESQICEFPTFLVVHKSMMHEIEQHLQNGVKQKYLKN